MLKMRGIGVFLLLSLIIQYANSQDTVDISDLRFVNGIVYLIFDAYTGVVVDNCNNIISNYYIGKKEGVEKSPNTIINYHNGIIIDYKLFTDDSIVVTTFKDSYGSQKITKISVGIWFDNQIQDTLFFDKTVNSNDSTAFKVGLLFFRNKKIVGFKEVQDLKVKDFSIDFLIPFLDESRGFQPSTNKLENYYLFYAPKFYISNLRLSFKDSDFYLKNSDILYVVVKE